MREREPVRPDARDRVVLCMLACAVAGLALAVLL
jgi:hypothetical protein